MADAPAWVDGEAKEGQRLTDPQIGRLLRMMEVLRIRENLEQVALIKEAIEQDEHAWARQLFAEFTDDEQQALWVAPTKGGIFTTRERKGLKNLL